MLVAFLDDNHDLNSKWLTQGGFIVHDSKLQEIEASFVGILSNYKIPIQDGSKDTEIKWSADKHNWIRNNLSGPVIEQLRGELLSSLCSFDPTLLITAVSYGNISKGSLDYARDYAFTTLFERLHEFGKHKNETVLVICDSEDSRDATKSRIRKTLELVRNGSGYLKLDRIYQHAWLVDSKHHAGIQLADLVTGITGSMIRDFTKYAEPHWQKYLRGRFLYLDHLTTPQRFGFAVLPTHHANSLEQKLDPYGCHSGLRRAAPY